MLLHHEKYIPVAKTSSEERGQVFFTLERKPNLRHMRIGLEPVHSTSWAPVSAALRGPCPLPTSGPPDQELCLTGRVPPADIPLPVASALVNESPTLSKSKATGLRPSVGGCAHGFFTNSRQHRCGHAPGPAVLLSQQMPRAPRTTRLAAAPPLGHAAAGAAESK